jgi:Asp-tRNA(Asn)/Glu-tRNA(Gln) amidotransferase A subunit family amidase
MQSGRREDSIGRRYLIRHHGGYRWKVSKDPNGADVRFARAVESPKMDGIRLGLVRQHFLDKPEDVYVMPWGGSVDSNVNAMLSAVATMRNAGAEIMDVNMDISRDDIVEFFTKTENVMYNAGFKEDFGDYLTQLTESPVRSIEELIKWNEDYAVSRINDCENKTDGSGDRVTFKST